MVAGGLDVGLMAGTGLLVARGVPVGAAVGVALRVATGVGVAVGVDSGVGVDWDVAVAFFATLSGAAVRATGVGVCKTTTAECAGDGVGSRRAAKADKSAPMPRPAMITPAKSGTIGNALRSSSSPDERRRRGRSEPELIAGAAFQAHTGDALDGQPRVGANAAPMVRVPVPIDLGTAVSAGATAFTFATPIRVVTLLELAIARVSGRRAPAEKCDRMLRSTLAGLRSGTFLLHVDGRPIDDPERVVVCSGSATLRFFVRRSAGLISSITAE
jgi:hypothetical protein